MTVNHLMVYPDQWQQADSALEADGPYRDEPCGICGLYPANGCPGDHTELDRADTSPAAHSGTQHHYRAPVNSAASPTPSSGAGGANPPRRKAA